MQPIFDNTALLFERYFSFISDHPTDPLFNVPLGGGSCGANFATVICMVARDRKLDIRPRGQILLSPFLSPNCDTPSWFKYGRGGYNNNREGALVAWKNYMSKAEDQLDPYFCPLRAENLSEMPKALIILGEHDPITDEGIIYGHMLKRAGVDTVMVTCILYEEICLSCRFGYAACTSFSGRHLS